MMTTLQRDRRTQRTTKFNLESLDDRIVPSAMGSEAAVAGHAHAAERAILIQQRHEARLAAREARHEARLARLAAKHAATMPPVSAIPIMNSTSLASTPSVTNSAMASGTITTPSATTNFFPLPFQTTNPTATTGTTTPSNPSGGTTTPLPPNVSAQLQSLYQQFESSGGSSNFTPTGLPGIVISGSNVGINVHTSDTANFNAILAQLQSDGLQVTNSSAAYGLIEGMLPIAQLPAVAQISSDLSITAQYHPTLK
jgi:hypothetical protein